MYSTFSNLRESFKLAWKHKLLWILAAALAGFGGGYGSSFSNSGGNSSRPSDENIFKSPDREIRFEQKLSPEDIVSFKSIEKVGAEFQDVNDIDTSQVMPQNTLNNYGNDKYNFPGINPTKIGVDTISLISRLGKIMLAASPFILALFVFLISISIVAKSWIKSSYFSGQLKVCSGSNLEFKDLGEGGNSNWSRYLKLFFYFVWLRFRSMLPLAMAIFLFVFLGDFAGSGSLGTVLTIIAVGLIFAAFIWFLFYNISLFFIEKFALRALSEEKVSSKDVYKLGKKYYKSRPGKSIKLLLALVVFIPFVGLILALPTFGLGFFTYVAIQNEINLLGVILGAVTGIIFISTVIITGPFLLTVGDLSWTRLYMFAKESFSNTEKTEGAPNLELSSSQNSEVVLNG